MNDFFGNFVGFDGRLNRQPFWLSGLVLAAIAIIILMLVLPLLGLSMVPDLAKLTGDASSAEIAALAAGSQRTASWVGLVLFIVFLYPSTALMLKRRHDRNNNGLDVMIYLALAVVVQLVTAFGIGMSMMTVNGTSILVPGPLLVTLSAIMGIFGIYLLVVLGFLNGTKGPNAYGPDPLGG